MAGFIHCQGLNGKVQKGFRKIAEIIDHFSEQIGMNHGEG